jgi:hypothetical protein
VSTGIVFALTSVVTVNGNRIFDGGQELESGWQSVLLDAQHFRNCVNSRRLTEIHHAEPRL